MGLLTEEMKRLSEEIGELHGARRSFGDSLRDTTLEMRADVFALRDGLREANAAMANATRTARLEFVSGVKRTVADLRRVFQVERKDTDNRMRTERDAFLAGVSDVVGGLKQSVAGLRQEFQADIAGARQAWNGPAPARRKGREHSARQRADGE